MLAGGRHLSRVRLQAVFANILNENDARRAAGVVELLLSHGLRCALTGGLATRAHLAARGRAVGQENLNDVDFVVASFTSIPRSLAGAFLPHHVHPDATDGRTLLQLVDEARALRMDLFLELGATLSRAVRCGNETGELAVVSLEDLGARNTALVFGRLGRGKTIDRKHVRALQALHGLGRPDLLDAAWQDHRQGLPGTIHDAVRSAMRLLGERPDLVVVEDYSADPTPCARCRPSGPFTPTPRDRIVEILGYC